MNFVEAVLIEASFGRYAFHGTTHEKLPLIARQGLVPQQGRHYEPAVFFGLRPEDALRWNPILLRFPVPGEWDSDPYSDTMYHPEIGWYANALWTPNAVPPTEIEVQTPEGWFPVTEVV